MKKKWICPLTDLRLIKPCQVTTCIWNSSDENKYPFRCAYRTTIMPDSIWARIKRVSVENIKQLKKEGLENINKILILQRYEEWLLRNSSSLPSMNIDIKSLLMDFPFTYPKNKWTESLLQTAFVQKNFDKFIAEESVSKNYSLIQILGVSKKRFDSIISTEE